MFSGGYQETSDIKWVETLVNDSFILNIVGLHQIFHTTREDW